MTYLVDTFPKVQARNYTNTNGRGVRAVVIHDMEAPENDKTAENVANYFHVTTVQASAHICVDNNSAVRCVDDNDVAWAAPGVNSDGLQLELAGYASQTRTQWQDPYSKDLLRFAARITASWCKKFNIPPKHLTKTELKAGQKGITSHRDITAVYKQSTHTDPGSNFPWDIFMALVVDYFSKNPESGTKPKPATPKQSINVKALEIATHDRHPNGLWGYGTDRALKTVRKGPSGRFDTKALQRVVGTKVDGKWGPNSQRAYYDTVKNIQKALHVGADGVWGPVTNKAFFAARNKYYLHF